MKTFLKQNPVKAGLAALGALILLLVVFQAGVVTGFHKARFAYQWGENYHRNFGGPKGGFMGDMRGSNRDFMPSHGIFGAIAKIDAGSLVLTGADGIERTILIDGAAVIRAGNDVKAFTDLAVDDRIVVIGTPDAEGRIAAKFVRIFPKDSPPPGKSSRFRH